jgi:predicted SAM-dependent methyltransferase
MQFRQHLTIGDPEQSNKGWIITEEKKDKILRKLQDGQGRKPFYTGRCYAEHIKNTQQ